MFICAIVFPIKLIGISFLGSSVYAVSIRSANVDMVHPLWRASFSSFFLVVGLVRIVMTSVFFSFMTYSLITRYTYSLDFSTLTLYTWYTLRGGVICQKEFVVFLFVIVLLLNLLLV